MATCLTLPAATAKTAAPGKGLNNPGQKVKTGMEQRGVQGRGGKAVWMRGASDPRTLLLSEKYLVNLAPNLFSVNKSNWQDAS